MVHCAFTTIALIICITHQTLYLWMVFFPENNYLITFFTKEFSIILGLFYKWACCIYYLTASRSYLLREIKTVSRGF